MDTVIYFPRVKLTERESEEPQLRSVEINNVWSHVSIPTYVSMAYILIKLKENFTFYICTNFFLFMTFA
jgi:hypothetical protein